MVRLPSLPFNVLILGALLCSQHSTASAHDKRLALVVAHQHGWQGEQMLPWVISGDVDPISRLLKHKLGFRVIRVVNRDAATLRKTFRSIQQQLKTQPIDTFLFYYSGHADKRYFHLGPRRNRALGYKEFLRFFLKLPVKRRFALLDACHGGAVIPLARQGAFRFQKGGKTHHQPSAILRTINNMLPRKKRFRSVASLRRWFHRSIAKGVKRPRKRIDFRRLPSLRREDGTGTHIIGTVGTAWHEPRLGASLLTYHILRGLRGAADTVKDGRITIEELYDFVQAETRKKGQELSRFVLFNGNYTFAPNYQSRLRISANVLGNVHVSVDQFVWSFLKKKPDNIEVPAISGKGVVEIRHNGRCWRQPIVFPKGSNAGLNSYGKRVRCRRLYATRKGSIQLQGLQSSLPTRQTDHHMGLFAGFSELGLAPLRSRNIKLGVGYEWRQTLGLGLFYEGGLGAQGWWLNRFSLQVDAGFPLHWNQWTLRGAVFARLGSMFSQTSNQTIPATSFAGTGGQIDLDWLPLRKWGLKLRLQVGINWTPTAANAPFSLQWGLQLANLLSL